MILGFSHRYVLLIRLFDIVKRRQKVDQAHKRLRFPLSCIAEKNRDVLILQVGVFIVDSDCLHEALLDLRLDSDVADIVEAADLLVPENQAVVPVIAEWAVVRLVHRVHVPAPAARHLVLEAEQASDRDVKRIGAQLCICVEQSFQPLVVDVALHLLCLPENVVLQLVLALSNLLFCELLHFFDCQFRWLLCLDVQL